jgi:hypothetical protein
VVPGTGTRATVAVARHAHAALAHGTPRPAAARIAERARRSKSAPHHAKSLAFAASVAVAPAAIAAAAAPAPAPERASSSERSVPQIIATVAQRVVAHARAEALPHGQPARRAPAIRPEAGPTETLAFVAPHRKCRTCFGPLRSPDDAVTEQTFEPAKTIAASSAGTAAITTDDPTSGPVDLGSGLIWYRLPARVQGP